MKSLTYSLIWALVILAACGKEKSFEQGQLSKGSLQSDATGDCLPKVVRGTYKVGAALVDTSTIQIQVAVTQTGPYTIKTDTINGYSFQASGNFTAVGSAAVVLKGTGTPIAAGINTFTVVYDSTSCEVPVTVQPATPGGGGGGGGGTTAVYTLSGTGANCLNYVVNGTYTQGTALTAVNTVRIELNVTTPGTYNITTNTVNGISFSGTGTLTASGVQTVILTGSGNPTPAGNPTFLVTGASGTCNFPVTIAPGTPPPPPPAGVHFPMTTNSWWSYEEYQGGGDTLLKQSMGTTATFGGNVYNIFEMSDEAGNSYEYYYRKTAANEYYEWTFSDYYSMTDFDGDPEGAILFLKEGLANGTTWNSAEFSGTVSGVPTKVRYKLTCTDANATVTVNGKTFNNVVKISMVSQTSINGAAYQDDGLVCEFAFARNIGQIDFKAILGGNVVYEEPIRFWRVL
jgi:hypothetical protein